MTARHAAVHEQHMTQGCNCIKEQMQQAMQWKWHWYHFRAVVVALETFVVMKRAFTATAAAKKLLK